MEKELLFSDDPKVRWQQAQKYAAQNANKLDEQIAQKFKEWPRYWWGAANAWLVFLGPSPGASKVNNQVDWSLPSLGKPHQHFLKTNDRNGFWKRLREWTINSFKLAGIFNDKKASFGITLMANVIDRNEGKANNISGHEFIEAMPKVLANFELIRPRIIVPMHKKVSKYLVRKFENKGASIVGGPTERLVKAPKKMNNYRPKSWQMKTSFGPLLIAEAPQHPSKKNFYIASEVDQYLARKIKSCLN